MAQIIGDRCFPDEKSELKDVLNESIEKMDEFIVKNAPVSREDLEKRKAAERDYIMNRPGLCDASNKDNVLMLYQSARDLGPAAIREQIAKLLAIPRKPTMNPCV